MSQSIEEPTCSPLRVGIWIAPSTWLVAKTCPLIAHRPRRGYDPRPPQRANPDLRLLSLEPAGRTPAHARRWKSPKLELCLRFCGKHHLYRGLHQLTNSIVRLRCVGQVDERLRERRAWAGRVR